MLFSHRRLITSAARLRVFVWLASIASVGPISLPAATFTWDGGAGTGAWGTNTNWNPDGAPANGDSLVFDASSANSQYSITLGSNRTTAGLTFNSAAGSGASIFFSEC
jgi:hypothetical protein